MPSSLLAAAFDTPARINSQYPLDFDQLNLSLSGPAWQHKQLHVTARVPDRLPLGLDPLAGYVAAVLTAH
jgi:hypothetical protein